MSITPPIGLKVGEKEEVRKMKESDYNLPQITGISQKQISYAAEMRNRYIERNKRQIKHTHELLATLDQDVLKEEAAKHNNTPEQFLREFMRTVMFCESAYIALTSTDAREIIDNVK